MKGKKGLVLSLCTLLTFIVLVWFASFYNEKVERSEQSIFESFAIEKAGFVADDITWDVKQLLGTGQDVNRGPKFTTIRLNDKLPADTNKMQLVDLANFIEGNYSTQQKASIGVDFSNLLDGQTEMLFSNNLEYDYAYSNDQNFVQFRKADGNNTKAFTYDINLYVGSGRLDTATAWIPCNDNGDVNVSLRYNDSYGESAESINCKLNSTGSYTYTFTFQEIEGSLTVRFGSVDGNLNAVRIRNIVKNPNIVVLTSIKAELPSPTEQLEWYYDADLNYAQQDVELNRKIGLGKA